MTFSLALAAPLCAVDAGALQLVPTSTSLLHTLSSGQPGAQWNTGGAGSGGQLSYNASTGVATLTGVLDVLNWFDSANAGCSTDTGSNCSFNYAPDLTFSLDAQLSGVSVVPVGGPNVNVTLMFQTTPNASPDLTVLDPTDLGFGSVLNGDWTAGNFNGNPTTGLSISVLFNTSTNTATFQAANVSGFLAIDNSTLYSSLFQSGTNYLGLNIATLSSFAGPAGNLNGIIAYAIANNALPNFTAEANGQVYRLSSGEFLVPEPTTAALVAAGLSLLCLRRRR